MERLDIYIRVCAIYTLLLVWENFYDPHSYELILKTHAYFLFDKKITYVRLLLFAK